MQKVWIENEFEKAEDNYELYDNDEPEHPSRLHGAEAIPIK